MDEQRKLVRRKAKGEYPIINRQTGDMVGLVLDLNIKGVKLLTPEPIEVPRLYYYEMTLPHKVNGSKQIFFDAESRWCEKREDTGYYECGFRLRNVAKSEKDKIEELTRHWMVTESEKINRKQPSQV